VLQPVLLRPLGPHHFQLIAGERRWRASKLAGIDTIPAMVDEIDDETAMEIAIIENLQREDLSPLDEAAMYDRMIREHGYSIRRLADKLGKDKGYVENRLRLADAPIEIRQLVSVRKDTLSHAYELLRVEDPKRRRRLADQVARGELSLVKLAAGRNLLLGESVQRKLKEMREELGGESPSPLEKLLISRVTATWLQASYYDGLLAQRTNLPPSVRGDFADVVLHFFVKSLFTCEVFVNQSFGDIGGFRDVFDRSSHKAMFSESDACRFDNGAFTFVTRHARFRGHIKNPYLIRLRKPAPHPRSKSK
jgi:ParB/RepB/Spo0J family partition protein